MKTSALRKIIVKTRDVYILATMNNRVFDSIIEQYDDDGKLTKKGE